MRSEITWDPEAMEAAIAAHGPFGHDHLRPHFLYRVFDAEGVLIYVGLTRAPWERFSAHRYTTFWYGQAARVDWEFVGDEAEARLAEREAIIAGRPLHNIQHNAVRVEALAAERATA